jgi:hypothetical protein
MLLAQANERVQVVTAITSTAHCCLPVRVDVIEAMLCSMHIITLYLIVSAHCSYGNHSDLSTVTFLEPLPKALSSIAVSSTSIDDTCLSGILSQFATSIRSVQASNPMCLGFQNKTLHACLSSPVMTAVCMNGCRGLVGADLYRYKNLCKFTVMKYSFSVWLSIGH